MEQVSNTEWFFSTKVQGDFFILIFWFGLVWFLSLHIEPNFAI